MTAHRRLALVLAVFAGTAAVSAAQEPPPDPAAMAALKKELEDTYLQIQRDYDLLTGPRAGETMTALEGAVAEEAKARAGTPVGPADFPGIWTRRKILGPIVAERIGARLPEATAKAAEEKSGEASTLGEALRIAAKMVFPEPSMADNWDKHFMDLEVVRRWAKAKGNPPAGPDVSRSAEAPDPADMVAIPKGDLQVPEQRGRGWPNPGQKAEKRSLKPYYIDRTEVTGAAFAAFLREVKAVGNRAKYLPLGWKLDDKGQPNLPEGAAPLPVTGVSYEAARAFAESLFKRLPTEDEWEHAARGNPGLKYPWGALPLRRHGHGGQRLRGLRHPPRRQAGERDPPGHGAGRHPRGELQGPRRRGRQRLALRHRPLGPLGEGRLPLRHGREGVREALREEVVLSDSMLIGQLTVSPPGPVAAH
jgi:formylglycine-generating enzyme required for sulfatase activity